MGRRKQEPLPMDWVEEDTGIGHVYRRLSDGSIQEDEIPNYEELYGEGDPDDTGEYYDDWMPDQLHDD